MADKVTLTVTKGPIQGRSFAFEQHDVLLFGRAQDCHVCLPQDDPTASRYHFLLEVNPPLARVRDVGSLNGTYVNGVKHGGREKGQAPEDVPDDHFPQVDLANGDTIRVGAHHLVHFLTRHTPFLGTLPEGRKLTEEEVRLALTRCGKPTWSEEDFQGLIRHLQHVGYGWLRPEGVRVRLMRMARVWKEPLALIGDMS